MALDPRIPLMAQGINIEPRSNALMRAAQLQGTQDTNALRQMQMQQMQQAAQQTMLERQAAAQRQQQLDGYLSSLSGQAGPPQPFNPAEAAQRLGIDGASKLQGLMQPKGSEGFTLTPGSVRYGPDGKPIASAPTAPEKPQAPPEIVRLMQYRDSLPPNDPSRKLIDAQLQKLTTHAPAAQAISYGSPVPVQLPDGNTGYAQPGNRPGAAPQIMAAPGGSPLVAPKKIGEKQANQNAGIDALGGAIDEYVSKLGTWKKADSLDPNKRADMGTFYNNVMLQAKEAYNLGVLNGPDLQILESVIQNPISIMGTVTSNEALAKQATNLKRMMNKIKAAQGGGNKPGNVTVDY